MSFLGRLGKPKYKGKVGNVPMLNKDGTLVDSGQEPGGGGGDSPFSDWKVIKVIIDAEDPTDWTVEAPGVTVDDLPKTFLIVVTPATPPSTSFEDYFISAYGGAYSEETITSAIYSIPVFTDINIIITIVYDGSQFKVAQCDREEVVKAERVNEILEAGEGIVVDLTEDEDGVEVHLDGDVISTLDRALKTPIVPPAEDQHYLVGIDDTGGQENIGIGDGLYIDDGVLKTTLYKHTVSCNSETIPDGGVAKYNFYLSFYSSSPTQCTKITDVLNQLDTNLPASTYYPISGIGLFSAAADTYLPFQLKWIRNNESEYNAIKVFGFKCNNTGSFSVNADVLTTANVTDKVTLL